MAATGQVMGTATPGPVVTATLDVREPVHVASSVALGGKPTPPLGPPPVR